MHVRSSTNLLAYLGAHCIANLPILRFLGSNRGCANFFLLYKFYVFFVTNFKIFHFALFLFIQ